MLMGVVEGVMWRERIMYVLFFFFQAEDGIRDVAVTGVQTCALPIYEVEVVLLIQQELAGAGVGIARGTRQPHGRLAHRPADLFREVRSRRLFHELLKIGRASCRERV